MYGKQVVVTVLLVLLGAGAVVAQPMGGAYTIKPSGGDFTDFGAACAALSSRGYTRACTMFAYTGTYTTWGNAQNFSSDTVPVVFKAAPGERPVQSYNGYGFNISGTDNLTFDSIWFSTGNHCIYAPTVRNMVVRNCSLVTTLSGYGVQLSAARACRVENNVMNGNYGMGLINDSDSNVVINNKITARANYGIFAYTSSGVKEDNFFINNFVSGYTAYGVYASYADRTRFYFNSFYSSGSQSDMYLSICNNSRLVDNIFYGGSAVCLYQTSGSIDTSNYNCFYTTNSSVNYYLGNYYNWAGWRGLGFDAGSINRDPRYISPPGDLHVQDTSACVGAGTPYAGVNYDIDGMARDAATPCIGADEVFIPAPDVGCTRILAPTGDVDSGTNVTPACSVYNYGNTTPASYNVRMKIGAYDVTTAVTDHAPGTYQYVAFTNWTAGARGSYAMTCSTELAGDVTPANDKATGSVNVNVCDVGPCAIAVPKGSYSQGAVVVPRATWRNLGTRAASGEAWMIVTDPTDGKRIFVGNLPIVALPAGESVEISFAQSCTLKTPGAWVARCSTYVAGDQVPANNCFDSSFTVTASGGGGGWTAKSPMPAGAKALKDGGWLAYDAGTARIYASRGQKQPDFFAYNPVKDSWKALAPWLPGVEAKLPGKGSAGCADGSGHIYATKGNNKSGFWKYDAIKDSWYQKKDVPLGLSNKKVKGGTDIVWAYKGTTGSPYLLKGYKNEFYRYVVGGDSWQTLTPAPVGMNQKWDKGSWLAYDDVNNKVYAFKSKYHEFYRYSPDGDSWSAALAPMPIAGSAGARKAKDGSCGAAVIGDFKPKFVYSLKGANTREFWQYTITTNSWAEKETIPTGNFKKKVKSGADIVAVGAVLYATKGNKTNELWMYTPGAFLFQPPQHDGAQAERVADGEWRMAIGPNPVTAGFATLSFTGALEHMGTGVLRLSIFDASGRIVLQSAICNLKSAMPLDLRLMPAGVYLVRVQSGNFTAAQKLVVQR
jgi:hypothetical protein